MSASAAPSACRKRAAGPPSTTRWSMVSDNPRWRRQVTCAGSGAPIAAGSASTGFSSQRPDTENRCLRQVENRREAVHAERAEVGDGEGAAVQQVGADRSGLRGGGQLVGARRQRGYGEPLGASDHRHHQATLGVHRKRQLHRAVALDAVPCHHRVEFREVRQRARHGVQHQVVDGDAAQSQVFGARLEARPIGEQRLGVGRGVHAELGGVAQRLLHALADQLAHAGDRHRVDRLGSGAGGGLRQAGSRSGGRRQVGEGDAPADAAAGSGHRGTRYRGRSGGAGQGRPCLCGRHHVTFDDAAVRPAAGQGGVVDAQLAGAAARTRRCGRTLPGRAPAGRRFNTRQFATTCCAARRRGARSDSRPGPTGDCGRSREGRRFRARNRGGRFRAGNPVRSREGRRFRARNRRRQGRGRRPICSRRSARGGGLLAGLAHRRDRGQHRHFLALGGEVRQHGARGRRLHLERRLVGLYLAQQFAGCHALARLLEPAHDRARLYRLALPRHYDFGCHMPAPA